MTHQPPTSSRVCAWCGEVLERNVQGLPGVSHGMCDACERQWLPSGATRQPDRPEGFVSNVSAIMADIERWQNDEQYNL